MMDKVDISIEITQYIKNIDTYNRWKWIALIGMILFPIPGLLWFIVRIRKKRKLDKKKQFLLDTLNQIGPEITLDEFLEMKKTIYGTRRK